MDHSSKVAYVTGISRGIGHALVHEFLKDGYKVFGIGRNNTINEPNYQFLQLDLRNMDQVAQFRFPQIQAQGYLLVNNAGLIGEIMPVGELSPHHIIEVMNVNSLSPQLLMNSFIQTFLRQHVPLHILNISSGAGKKPIDSWATYCASKSSLDLFSETLKTEMVLRNQSEFYVHSFSPGVADTEMQNIIRSASPEKFKSLQRFLDLKTNNELKDPAFVAKKLMRLIQNPGQFPNTLLSIHELD